MDDTAKEVVSAEIPHKIQIHWSDATASHTLSVQASLSSGSDLQGFADMSPVASVVDTVTHALIYLTERKSFIASVVPGGNPELDLDEGWSLSLTGATYHQHLVSRTEGDLVL